MKFLDYFKDCLLGFIEAAAIIVLTLIATVAFLIVMTGCYYLALIVATGWLAFAIGFTLNILTSCAVVAGYRCFTERK